MATTKIWKVQKRLDHVIDYATNEEKTKKILMDMEWINLIVSDK